LGILRPSEFFLEVMQSKSGVNALPQDAACFLFTVYDENMLRTGFSGS
jgi:hypothetical protein